MKASVFACVLIFAAVAGVAQTPSDAPAAPVALSSPPLADSSGTAASGEAIFASNRKSPTKASCSATANCGSGTTVSCTGTVTPGSVTCTAIDRDCSILERGRVTCNGGATYTLCPKTCHCEEVCNCSVPCLEPCTSGGGFVQECGSWGFCSTSCACGGECLAPGDGPPPIPNSGLSGDCAAPAGTGDLRAKIFN